MSDPFKKAMLDIGDMLKEVYQAEHAVVIPGSGTYGMEATARQFATGKKAMVIRNGFFSFRWTQIFEAGNIASEHLVMQARPVDPSASKLQYAPAPIEEVVSKIMEEKPAVVFAPHVETSTGIILPNDYIKKVSDAIHSVGGLMVLDCIAAGTVWAKMEDLGIDALITAPQKGWTGPSCAGLVMLSKRGAEVTRSTESTSFTINLRKWLELMDTYEAGGFSYHATMPTDALMMCRDVMLETKKYGFDQVEEAAWKLGGLARDYIQREKGLISVAAPGFEAPGVVVVHTEDPAVAGKFIAAGTQIAAGVPFMIGESPETKTFRIGLFGLDKLKDPTVTVNNLRTAFELAVPTAQEPESMNA
jgi:aspartate aminotransferase-like enzyme